MKFEDLKKRSKAIFATPADSPLQNIYVASLARPPGGYSGSSKFRPAPFDCPRCAGAVWVRLRHDSLTPIGATCADCAWLTTHPQKTRTLSPPKQTELPW